MTALLGQADAGAARVRGAIPDVLWRIAGLLGSFRTRLAVTTLFSTAATLASLAAPRLLGEAVNEAVSTTPGAALDANLNQRLLVVGFLTLVAFTLRGVLSAYAAFQAEYVSYQAASALRISLFTQLQRLPLSFYDRTHSGDLTSRAISDVEGVRAFLQALMQQGLPLLLLAIFAGAMMARSDGAMALVALSFLPVTALALARMGLLLRQTWIRIQKLTGDLSIAMEEAIHGVRVVRAFHAAGFELARFQRIAEAILGLSRRRVKLRVEGVSVMQASFYLSLGALLWWTGPRLGAGQMTAGRLTEFIAYMMILQGPIRSVGGIFNLLGRALPSAGRVFEILDLRPEITDGPDVRDLGPDADLTLRLEAVSFAHSPNVPPVLRGIDIVLEPGKRLGILGAPGSGKSTLASLIPRFREVTSGRIMLGGADIRELSLASLRRRVCVVSQDAFLFNIPIDDNVAYALAAPDPRAVSAALRAAQLHDFVATLPEGGRTLVGERGENLSGGQRGRLALARGLAAAPGLLVLDDVTAAMDSVTEARILDDLFATRGRRSTIIIAHRLASLRHADEILVLDEGRIVERGDHQQLMVLEGRYAALNALQSAECDGDTAGHRR